MKVLLKQSVTIILMAVTAFNCLATDTRNTTINDLRYGEALYHFYQHQYFSAITNLMIAKDKKPITDQEADPELLLGGLYLYYGLHSEANNIFTGLLDNKSSREIQDKVWFNIGKMQYQGKLMSEAQQTLQKISLLLSPEKEAEKQNMLANTYLSQLDFTSAYDALNNLSEYPDWQAYAQYNMGISLIKTGNVLAGTQLLNNISVLETNDEELKTLKDKVNIALGYAHIRNTAPAISTTYLEKVRLNGPLSAKALLGIGWSYQQQNLPEKALIPWMELRNWPVIDTAVQESLLAVPYTLEQMGKNQLALENYAYAIKNYDAELINLDNVLNAVKAGQLLFALKPAMLREDALAPEYINKLPDSIASPYMHYLLNNVDFQHVHKNYLDLIYLKKNLSDWKNQFPAYSLMLKERRAYFEKQKDSLQKDTRLTLMNKLIAKRDSIAREIQRIKDQHDIFALVTEDEQEILDDLNNINSSLKRLENKTDISEQKVKHKLLYGLMLWDISTDYTPRLWKVQNELNQVNSAITIGMKNLVSLKNSGRSAPLRFTGYNDIIQNKAFKLNNILNNINYLLNEQEKYIEQQALITLRQRYRQIESYLNRASYSLARLHDRMTLPHKSDAGANK